MFTRSDTSLTTSTSLSLWDQRREALTNLLIQRDSTYQFLAAEKVLGWKSEALNLLWNSRKKSFQYVRSSSSQEESRKKFTPEEKKYYQFYVNNLPSEAPSVFRRHSTTGLPYLFVDIGCAPGGLSKFFTTDLGWKGFGFSLAPAEGGLEMRYSNADSLRFNLANMADVDIWQQVVMKVTTGLKDTAFIPKQSRAGRKNSGNVDSNTRAATIDIIGTIDTMTDINETGPAREGSDSDSGWIQCTSSRSHAYQTLTEADRPVAFSEVGKVNFVNLGVVVDIGQVEQDTGAGSADLTVRSLHVSKNQMMILLKLLKQGGDAMWIHSLSHVDTFFFWMDYLVDMFEAVKVINTLVPSRSPVYVVLRGFRGAHHPRSIELERKLFNTVVRYEKPEDWQCVEYAVIEKVMMSVGESVRKVWREKGDKLKNVRELAGEKLKECGGDKDMFVAREVRGLMTALSGHEHAKKAKAHRTVPQRANSGDILTIPVEAATQADVPLPTGVFYVCGLLADEREAARRLFGL
jgi:hypothetical protein